MTAFFTVITIFSAITLAADVFLRYVLKIRRFGLERNFFSFHGEIIPIEKFLPNSVTQLAGFLLAFGVSGLLLDLFDLVWYISLFFSLLAAMISNFVVTYFIARLRSWLKEPYVDKNGFPSGTTAVCVESITDGGYGKIEVEYKKTRFQYPALSANETDIETGEKVIIVDMNQGIYWVETDNDVYDILNEGDENNNDT